MIAEAAECVRTAHESIDQSRKYTNELTDLIDNLSDITDVDPGFARISLSEKKLQVQVHTESHPELFQRVQKIILDEALAKQVPDSKNSQSRLPLTWPIDGKPC